MKNSSLSHFFEKIFGGVFVVLFLAYQTAPVQAAILFQDDTFAEVSSDAIIIGSDDGGAVSTAIQFGNDVTPSENGTITWDISTNTFDFDHSIDITGGVTVSGTTTLNGSATIGDGGDDISINSNDWNISSAGVASGFTGLSTSGTLSSTGSLEVSGNANIGDGGDDVFINSNDWDISSAGVASGFTGMTSTGAIDYTGSTYRGPQGSADPGTCVVGNYFYNTTSNVLKVCTATNTWSPLLRTDTSQNITAGTLTFNSGTTLTSSGVVNFTSATSFRPPQGAADPGTCSVGQEFYNTTSNTLKVCTSANNWTIAVGPNGADQLDGVDSTQFLRSDATDNYTSGTLTLENGTTLAVGGTAQIGDGGDDVFVNSNDWDISSAGVASGFTGFTSTGTVNLSGTSSLRIREGADEATAACTTVKEIFLDTTENRAYVCTVTGSPGTWVGVGSGDAQTVDGIDSGSFLRSDASDTYSSGTLTFDDITTLQVFGVATIGDNGDAVTVNSNTWDISGAGVGSGFTGFTTSGTLSSTGSLSVSGTATIGDGGDDIVINSNDWDISSAGVATGFTGITSTGTIDFSAASNITIPHTNSTVFTLDNDNAGAGVNVDIVANQGANPDGTIRYNTTTNQWEISNDGGGFVPLAGWHGSNVRIKLAPSDFLSDDADDNFTFAADGTQASASSATTDAGVSKAIPTGYRATHVLVYGSDAGNTVNVFANEITNGTTATSLGSGNINTEINITDLDSTATNYLSIFVNLGTSDDIFGGYITIAPIP